MPTFFSSSSSKRNGPQYAKDNATAIVLSKNPLKTDTWAQALAKIVAQAAITGTDISLVDVGDDVQVTVNPKSGIDQSQSAELADDICMMIIDETNEEVLYCVDANDKVITNEALDTIDLPAISFFIREFKAV
mgnify:CR=1 FL=1